MEFQPSPFVGTSKPCSGNDGPAPTNGIRETVASTSGSPAAIQQQEKKLRFTVQASMKELRQLFGSTCQVKIQRCEVPNTTREVKVVVLANDSETGNGSWLDDDEIILHPISSAAQPPTKKKGKTVSSLKPACCTICKKTLCSKYNLKRHIVTVHIEDDETRPYRRRRRGKTLRSPGGTFAIQNKKKNQNNNGVCLPLPKKRPQGAWKCKLCGKIFKCASYFLNHIRRHRAERPFKCEECGKNFKTKVDLYVHRVVHSTVWKHTCVFCGKGFNHKHHLFNHLRGHTEEKPFHCLVEGCGRFFRWTDSLRHHRQSYHFEKCESRLVKELLK